MTELTGKAAPIHSGISDRMEGAGQAGSFAELRDAGHTQASKNAGGKLFAGGSSALHPNKLL